MSGVRFEINGEQLSYYNRSNIDVEIVDSNIETPNVDTGKFFKTKMTDIDSNFNLISTLNTEYQNLNCYYTTDYWGDGSWFGQSTESTTFYHNLNLDSGYYKITGYYDYVSYTSSSYYLGPNESWPVTRKSFSTIVYIDEISDFIDNVLRIEINKNSIIFYCRQYNTHNGFLGIDSWASERTCTYCNSVVVTSIHKYLSNFEDGLIEVDNLYPNYKLVSPSNSAPSWLKSDAFNNKLIITKNSSKIIQCYCKKGLAPTGSFLYRLDSSDSDYTLIRETTGECYILNSNSERLVTLSTTEENRKVFTVAMCGGGGGGGDGRAFIGNAGGGGGGACGCIFTIIFKDNKYKHKWTIHVGAGAKYASGRNGQNTSINGDCLYSDGTTVYGDWEITCGGGRGGGKGGGAGGVFSTSGGGNPDSNLTNDDLVYTYSYNVIVLAKANGATGDNGGGGGDWAGSCPEISLSNYTILDTWQNISATTGGQDPGAGSGGGGGACIFGNAPNGRRNRSRPNSPNHTGFNWGTGDSSTTNYGYGGFGGVFDWFGDHTNGGPGGSGFVSFYY